MSNNTQSAYLVIADISGYTSYLAKTELEHSQEVLAELLSLIVRNFKPLLTILRLEGDAVFANAPEEQIPRGETLVEILETTYTAFRDHIRGIVQLTTCECNACRAIPMLDLKFIVHYGDYIVQNISGIKELVGTEINRLFRLTKNHVNEQTGYNSYILYTAASLKMIGLEPLDMIEMVESYEHLGEVTIYIVDLHQRFQEISAARHIVLEPQEAHATFDFYFDAPPQVVWEWLNDPRRRNQVDQKVSWSPAARLNGRTKKGATNHCAHGKNVLTCETILDWRPFEYVTSQMTTETMPHKLFDMTRTDTYEAVEDGMKTRVEVRTKLAHVPGFIARRMLKSMAKMLVETNFEPANKLIQETYGQPTAEPAGDLISSAAAAQEAS